MRERPKRTYGSSAGQADQAKLHRARETRSQLREADGASPRIEAQQTADALSRSGAEPQFCLLISERETKNSGQRQRQRQRLQQQQQQHHDILYSMVGRQNTARNSGERAAVPEVIFIYSNFICALTFDARGSVEPLRSHEGTEAQLRKK